MKRTIKPLSNGVTLKLSEEARQYVEKLLEREQIDHMELARLNDRVTAFQESAAKLYEEGERAKLEYTRKDAELIDLRRLLAIAQKESSDKAVIIEYLESKLSSVL